MKKRLTSFICLAVACTAMAVFSNQPVKKISSGKLYAGLGYVVSKRGATAEQGLILSVWSVAHSAISGAAYGAVFGGPAGAAVGVGIGL